MHQFIQGLICLLRVLAAAPWYDPSAGRNGAGKLVSGRPVSELTSGGEGGGDEDGEDVWMDMDAQVWQVVRLTRDGVLARTAGLRFTPDAWRSRVRGRCSNGA